MHILCFDQKTRRILELPIRCERHPICFEIVRSCAKVDVRGGKCGWRHENLPENLGQTVPNSLETYHVCVDTQYGELVAFRCSVGYSKVRLI